MYLLISLVPRLSSHAHRKGFGKLPIQFWYVCQDLGTPIRLQNSDYVIIFQQAGRTHRIKMAGCSQSSCFCRSTGCAIRQAIDETAQYLGYDKLSGVPVKAITSAKDVFISIPTRTGKSLYVCFALVFEN